MLVGAGCSGRHHHGMPSGHGGEYGEGSADRIVPEVKGIIDRNVKNPQTATQVEGLLQEIVAEVQASKQKTRGFHEQLNVLNADYNAAPEQFMSVLDQLNNARMQSSTKILATRFKIKELLTADEWKAMTDDMARVRQRYMH
jgi:hypothetical protein